MGGRRQAGDEGEMAMEEGLHWFDGQSTGGAAGRQQDQPRGFFPGFSYSLALQPSSSHMAAAPLHSQ
jgi:hypothetical protein